MPTPASFQRFRENHDRERLRRHPSQLIQPLAAPRGQPTSGMGRFRPIPPATGSPSADPCVRRTTRPQLVPSSARTSTTSPRLDTGPTPDPCVRRTTRPQLVPSTARTSATPPRPDAGPTPEKEAPKDIGVDRPQNPPGVASSSPRAPRRLSGAESERSTQRKKSRASPTTSRQPRPSERGRVSSNRRTKTPRTTRRAQPKAKGEPHKAMPRPSSSAKATAVDAGPSTSGRQRQPTSSRTSASPNTSGPRPTAKVPPVAKPAETHATATRAVPAPVDLADMRFPSLSSSSIEFLDLSTDDELEMVSPPTSQLRPSQRPLERVAHAPQPRAPMQWVRDAPTAARAATPRQQSSQAPSAPQSMPTSDAPARRVATNAPTGLQQSGRTASASVQQPQAPSTTPTPSTVQPTLARAQVPITHTNPADKATWPQELREVLAGLRPLHRRIRTVRRINGQRYTLTITATGDYTLRVTP